MSERDRARVDAIIRRDLNAFTHRCFQTVSPGQQFLSNWHIEAITRQLDLIRRGEIRRLIITLPPRGLKSICASVAFPAWVLGHDPSVRIVAASYSQDLTTRHARDCRRILESTWYKRLFRGTRIDPRKNTEAELETTARGYRYGTSVGGTLTGRGGNLIIIDDPMKPADAASDTKRAAVAEWYDATLSSRLDSKTEGAIVLIMQRFHVDDLVGHVLENGEEWSHLNLPAIAESAEEIPIADGEVYRRAAGEPLHAEREPLSALATMKTAMGSLVFSAQYQQAPVPPGGALIRETWLRSYTRAPDYQPGDKIVQSWDTASKADERNDFSVCTTWLMRGTDYYLLDVDRDRLEFPALRRRVLALADRWDATAVLIEDASSGAPLIQELRETGKLWPIAIRPDREKFVRLEGQTAVIEAGHVFLPEAAPWLDDFLTEILSFPRGRFDDQVDSVSQFLAWAATHRRRQEDIPVAPVLITADDPFEPDELY